jgi:hypothetical protein
MMGAAKTAPEAWNSPSGLGPPSESPTSGEPTIRTPPSFFARGFFNRSRRNFPRKETLLGRPSSMRSVGKATLSARVRRGAFDWETRTCGVHQWFCFSRCPFRLTHKRRVTSDTATKSGIKVFIILCSGRMAKARVAISPTAAPRPAGLSMDTMRSRSTGPGFPCRRPRSYVDLRRTAAITFAHLTTSRVSRKNSIASSWRRKASS